jgi:hypothetical protein
MRSDFWILLSFLTAATGCGRPASVGPSPTPTQTTRLTAWLELADARLTNLDSGSALDCSGEAQEWIDVQPAESRTAGTTALALPFACGAFVQDDDVRVPLYVMRLESPETGRLRILYRDLTGRAPRVCCEGEYEHDGLVIPFTIDGVSSAAAAMAEIPAGARLRPALRCQLDRTQDRR